MFSSKDCLGSHLNSICLVFVDLLSREKCFLWKFKIVFKTVQKDKKIVEINIFMIKGLANITLKTKEKSIKKFQHKNYQQNSFSQRKFNFLLKLFSKLLNAFDVIYEFDLDTLFTFHIVIKKWMKKITVLSGKRNVVL